MSMQKKFGASTFYLFLGTNVLEVFAELEGIQRRISLTLCLKSKIYLVGWLGSKLEIASICKLDFLLLFLAARLLVNGLFFSSFFLKKFLNRIRFSSFVITHLGFIPIEMHLSKRHLLQCCLHLGKMTHFPSASKRLVEINSFAKLKIVLYSHHPSTH